MRNKILIFILAVIVFSSCERKQLYLRGDCAINVNITSQIDVRDYVDIYWNPGWRDSLIYDWNKTNETLGYTFPNEAELVIFDGNQYTVNRLKTNMRQLVDVELNKTYNFLIYNSNPPYTESSYVGGRYYIETPVIHGIKNPFGDNYETCECPGDVFSAYIKNIHLSDDITDYEEAYDGEKLIYVYNIDADIVPVSYIYIIQFIIVNDDHSEVIEVENITGFTISGICAKKNLFTNEGVYSGKKQVRTTNIKPGQLYGDSLIFASRLTVLGLLPDDDSSWSTYHNYLYYTGIDIITKSYGSISGIIDITEQLNKNPKGGIITIKLNNSDLKKASKDETGFGVELSDWEIVVIDVPF